MFEEINFAGDGGLYAELVRNRAFQGDPYWPQSLAGWDAVNGASLQLLNLSNPLSWALPTSLRVSQVNTTTNLASRGSSSSSTATIGFLNEGWWGIDIRPQLYTGSFYVQGAYTGSFTASLKSNTTGEVWATAKIVSRAKQNEWVQHHYTLEVTSKASDENNTLQITFDAQHAVDGYLDFNLVSLFPPTWNNRPNGLRRDIIQAQADLNPKFLRFPGGSDLEGQWVGAQWKWNETIGDLRDRPGKPSTWGYHETNGLGLVEYMLWCEDLGLEPILAVWDGLWADAVLTTNDTLAPYIQWALDELEFLTGPADSTWGKVRADLGYPEPWTINFVEIGNEDNLSGGGASYPLRLELFYDAISAQYPDIYIIASTIAYSLPGDAGGDYHDYSPPDRLVSRFNIFDNLPGDGHKYLLGEYSSLVPNGRGINYNDRESFPIFQSWVMAVSEAVFLVGTERNADRLIGATYAPMLQNVPSRIYNGENVWAPDLISFTTNPDETVRSTSWHVLQLFSSNPATETRAANGTGPQGPLYWVTGYNADEDAYLFKGAVYNSTGDVPITLRFDVPAGKSANLTVLTAESPFDANVVGGPNVVLSTTTLVTAGDDGDFSFSLPNYSVAVLKTL
ncbi:alpha-L-arabinofuranosidase A [Xylariales sp. PMI_506]|nr:alpha-L-arabinofuranosidase A [Xylariales sp. PMI_506]